MLPQKPTLLAIVFCLFTASTVKSAELRASKQDEYARTLWKYIEGEAPWTNWTPGLVGLKPAYGPKMTESSRAYVNPQGWTNPWDYGSLIVARHYANQDKQGGPVSLTVWYRVSKGYDATQNDWYWAHYLANGTLLATSVDKNPHARRGYVTIPREDRLWVFSQADPRLTGFLKDGKIEPSVERTSEGKQLVAPDNATLDGYLTAEKK